MGSKLNVFDYIARASEVLEDKREGYMRSAVKLSAFLEKVFEDEDEVLGVTYRIKTCASLKEKIIRNDLYKLYGADEVVQNCSDIIGLRMECRFLQDEKTVYDRLKELFCVPRDDGFFVSELKRNVYLKLDTPQPEYQKNGQEIYRIDGYTVTGGETYKFELQIKSLVNSFWSEIEHKIIYKNKRFMMIDNFVSELMSTINDNLRGIDKQLNMLFKRCLDTSTQNQQVNVENTLVLMINELYSQLVEQKAGISVNIKPYSESLVEYILRYSSFAQAKGEDDFEIEAPYGGTVMRIIDWMRTVDFDTIDIGSEIVFDNEFAYANELERAVGEKFLSSINSDFYCNTFFHILFSLEVGNNAQDFMSYVRYYARRVGDGKPPEAEVLIRYEIVKGDAGKLLLEKEIKRLEDIR